MNEAMFNKECYDCKYFVAEKCEHPYKDECKNCSLWWAKENQDPETQCLCGFRDTILPMK